jgi:hypothetical protein
MHDPVKDLENEIYGMRYTTRFCEDLTKADLEKGSVLSQLCLLYDIMGKADYIPRSFSELGSAWCSDIEAVL